MMMYDARVSPLRMFLPALNFPALLSCTAASMIVGMLWFSPLLFAEPWMKLAGVSSKSMKAGPGPWVYLVSMLTGFASALVLSYLMVLLNIRTTADAILLALFLWFALVALMSLNHFLYTGRSRSLWLIEVGYDLCMLLSSAVILSLWR